MDERDRAAADNRGGHELDWRATACWVVSALVAMAAMQPMVLSAQSAGEKPGLDSGNDMQADSIPALTVAPTWDTARFMGSRTRLRFSLNRPLLPARERLALVIGAVDVSTLLYVDDADASYTPGLVPLPSGESEIVAYVIRDGSDWVELARAPLRVRSRVGLDEMSARPSIDLASTGQVALGNPADVPPPERHAYQDLTLRVGVESNVARDRWRIATNANAVGVSQEEQRLRFTDLQQDAPVLDLSDYRIQASHPGIDIVLGHQSIGQHRYLLNGFGSRGFGTTVRLGPRVAVDASLVNGTNVAGWSNPLGLAEPRHRIASAGMSFELLPERPGAVHLHLTGLNGSLLPRTGFTQAAATDAERSFGGGARLSMSTANQRARFEAGFARSRFTNPADPLLERAQDVVAVRPETRSARFAELSLELLRDMPIVRALKGNLTTTIRHERTDPLYRSVGAYVQSDRNANGVDLTGALGALSVRAAMSRAYDNLQNIPSILTTHTNASSFGGALPLGSLVGTPVAPLLPVASYSRERTRQYGESVPIDGGFDPSHVPDQVSVVETVMLQWGVRGYSLDYRWNSSRQDNRQPGRERADFTTGVQSVSLGGFSVAGLNLSIDVSRERQVSVETDAVQRLDRVGGSLHWQPRARTDFLATISHARGAQVPANQRTRNTEYQLELSRGFDLYRRIDGATQGRLFIRYARTRAVLPPFELQQLHLSRITWTLNAGGSIRLF